jgi:hypothetical protein
LSGIDLSQIVDEDVASSCEIRSNGTQSCFNKPAYAAVVQSDQSKIAVYVVKSLKVEPAAHITSTGIGDNLPLAIVSLGDFTLLGTLDAHGQDIHANAGGFMCVLNQKGSGPGGGAVGSATTGGGGASSCGLGGQGNAAMGSGAAPGPKTPAAGTPEIIPLQGGSSGGAGSGSQGGAGGGGVQLVAGGAFTTGAGSYVNVGGGGGAFGATGSGGGAGGTILIEATTVKIAGVFAANGGGGGGSGAGLDSGGNGSADSTPAAGGAGAVPGAAGSGGTTMDGATPAAPIVSSGASGGGGGAGRIRLNSQSGQADVASATFSPAASTPCVTQGTVKKK